MDNYNRWGAHGEPCRSEISIGELSCTICYRNNSDADFKITNHGADFVKKTFEISIYGAEIFEVINHGDDYVKEIFMMVFMVVR